jgi:hypothetical protein
METIDRIPENHTLDFIAAETIADYSYYFRKVYLPSALIRLSQGDNFIGEREVYMTGRGDAGYYEARDYFHGAPEYGQTLQIYQGYSEENVDLSVIGMPNRKLPNIAQVIGIRVDPALVSDPYYGKFYIVDSSLITAQAIDAHSRLGLYRLLGSPAGLDRFVEDIDPSLETELQLRHIG